MDPKIDHDTNNFKTLYCTNLLRQFFCAKSTYAWNFKEPSLIGSKSYEIAYKSVSSEKLNLNSDAKNDGKSHARNNQII